MTTSHVLPSRLPESQLLQLAVAGYLARFKGISRTNAESDLRVGCQNSVTLFNLGVYATGACRTRGVGERRGVRTRHRHPAAPPRG